MALKYADRVAESTISTGLGDINLAGAIDTDHATFGSQFADGDTMPVTVFGGGKWLTFIGQYNLGANSLSRITFRRSSTGSNLSLSGTMTVLCGWGADDAAAIAKLDIHGADVASAVTLNLEAATGDLIDVTGTTTVTAITLADGHERTVRFTGALTLTHGSSLVLPGAANVTTAAGDFAVFRGYASGVVRCVDYTRSNGKALMPAVVAIKQQFFSASGTYTPSAGMLYTIIECIGGGGGGGGAIGSGGATTTGGGGGAGSRSIKYVTAADIGANKPVTIGGGGGAGTGTPTPGGAGGDTSLGSLCIAKGGSGGNYGNGSAVFPFGGAGGVAGTGDIAAPGQAGLGGVYIATVAYLPSGAGGSGPYGAGGVGAYTTSFAAGNPGTGYGAGGSGAATSNSGAGPSGSAGSGGCMLITEFCSQA
jgi:hypothetical protein